MLKKVKVPMVQITCDNCGIGLKEVETELLDPDLFDTQEEAEEIADDNGWMKKDKFHYCGRCWSYDDNENVVLRTFD